MNKIWGLSLLFLLVGTSARAQDCDTYQEKDFFVPTELANIGSSIQGIVSGENSLYYWGSGGVWRLNFTDNLESQLETLRTEESFGISVDGNLGAFLGDGFVEIVNLSQGDSLASLPTEDGSICQLNGSRLMVVNLHVFSLYDVSTPSSPVLLGEIEFELPFTSWLPVEVSQRAVLTPTFAVVCYFSSGGIHGSYRGGLVAFDLTNESSPQLSSVISEPPFESEGATLWNGIVNLGDRIVAAGTTCNNRCRVGAEYGFCVEVEVSNRGAMSYGPYITFPIDIVRDFVPWENKVVVTTEVGAMYYNSESTQVVSFPEWGAQPLVVSSEINYQRIMTLGALPQYGLLSGPTDVFHMWSLSSGEGNSVFQNPMGVRELAVRDGIGYYTYYRAGAGYGDPGSSSFKSYDLSNEQPLSLDEISVIPNFYAELFFIGNRVYTKEEPQYIDISDPENLGSGQKPEILLDAFLLQWDGYVIVSKPESELTVYSLDEQDNLIFVSDIMVPEGQLTRVGEYLYVTSGYLTRIIDMSDPIHPQFVRHFNCSGGIMKLESDDLLLVASESAFQWYDVSDHVYPNYLGSWELGAPIMDFVRSGDRVYVGLGSRGLLVLDFNADTGFSLIGGDLQSVVTGLALVNDKIWAGHNDQYLLECDDILPVFVPNFSCVLNEADVLLSWSAHISGSENGDFVLSRLSQGSRIELSRQPVRPGDYSFLDIAIPQGQTHVYQLELYNSESDRRPLASQELRIENSTEEWTSLTVSPNPANPGTLIQFNLIQNTNVELNVYSLAGRHVANLAQGSMAAGSKAIFWDGSDSTGKVVSSGVYLVSLETEQGRTTRRVVVAK